jgi:N utilization substance protein A
MAKTQPKRSAGEIKPGLLTVLDQLEREKGIKKDDILRMIEQAMISAYRKHTGEPVNVEAQIDAESGEIKASVVKKVVEQVVDPAVEITLEDAKKTTAQIAIGDDLKFPIDTEEFGRIAAQTAKQVLIQKIRETERETVFDEYKPKEGILVSGAVHRFQGRDVIVDLGRAEGILPVREQVRRERWSIGDRIRVLMLKVDKGPRGPEIILSRAHADFVRRLFEQEVPEIYEKTVEVVDVVREPGQRSKVVVRSLNPKVDPIGACVGVKGSRVRPIINELQGERIDLVSFSNDPASYIAASLAPAKPLSVSIADAIKKEAEVLVSDDTLSLAIGKAGQNVRLASKLTGWTLNIKSESQKKQDVQAHAQASREELSTLEGVGPKTTEALLKGGWAKVEKLARARPDDLTVLSGIGEKTAEKIISAAQERLKEIAKVEKDKPPEETPGNENKEPSNA